MAVVGRSGLSVVELVIWLGCSGGGAGAAICDCLFVGGGCKIESSGITMGTGGSVVVLFECGCS